MQIISKAWTALVKATSLAPLANMVSPYISIDSEKKQFHVLSEREQGLTTREQLHHLLHQKSAVYNGTDMDTEV